MPKPYKKHQYTPERQIGGLTSSDVDEELQEKVLVITHALLSNPAVCTGLDVDFKLIVETAKQVAQYS